MRARDRPSIRNGDGKRTPRLCLIVAIICHHTQRSMKSKLVSRAEHVRLKAKTEQLTEDVLTLSQSLKEIYSELRVQFTRIAQMQAILDEERAEDRPQPEARPLYRSGLKRASES